MTSRRRILPEVLMKMAVIKNLILKKEPALMLEQATILPIRGTMINPPIRRVACNLKEKKTEKEAEIRMIHSQTVMRRTDLR